MTTVVASFVSAHDAWAFDMPEESGVMAARGEMDHKHSAAGLYIRRLPQWPCLAHASLSL